MSNKLRMVLAETEKKETPPDIEQALELWRSINRSQHQWATFEAIQFEHERIVRVEWGSAIGSFKETSIQTVVFVLDSDGRVAITRHTHN